MTDFIIKKWSPKTQKGANIQRSVKKEYHYHPHGIGHWPAMNEKSTAHHASHSMVTPIA
jgi:hypothetical protein